MGTPTHAYDNNGSLVWERELDIYGSLRKGDSEFVPFLYQGQYVDAETGLAYNRFRYYDNEAGNISQDPIGLDGGFEFYNYVHDSNSWLDIFGLSGYLLGKNLDKAGQAVTFGNRSTDWNTHHVIPQETWDKFGTTRRGGNGFFNEVGFKGKHNAANGIYLPNNEALAKKLGFAHYHPGSHPNFSNHVEARIKAIQDQYRIHKDKARAKADLEKMQARLKKRLSPDGSKAPTKLNQFRHH
ncbi:RHS repeat-associated core domain-containing protein [Chryseobacterium sp. c4a]|uniref:RHS repeat-associated core domain-containing protein n=1 Tax=Chryseobacterium sp. c4a TaxID=1573582 RepID=UPI00293B9C08|nr:RHS repeat-associated core domain-containing protein [Chryseobacterium sp. c4a]